jgi:ABC-type sugar transport system substrate-binding protein
VRRDPEHLSPSAARLATLPAGHPQGYADCFDLFVADVYAAARGEAPADGMPVFADGLRAAQIMENILQAQKKIDAVYTHDDDMAQGVVQAIRNANRQDEMFLTGVGGSTSAMKQIKEGGLYRATFLYNPNMAATAVNMARLIALGQGFPELVPPEVPRQLIVPAAVVTKANVAQYEKYAFN